MANGIVYLFVEKAEAQKVLIEFMPNKKISEEDVAQQVRDYTFSQRVMRGTRFDYINQMWFAVDCDDKPKLISYNVMARGLKNFLKKFVSKEYLEQCTDELMSYWCH